MTAETRLCPDCSSPLKSRAKSCGCGWKAPGPSAPVGSPGSAFVNGGSDLNRHRCTWESNSVRCRYPGPMSVGIQGGGARFCYGHMVCADTADGDLGQRIVVESIERIPDGVDYSSAGMVSHGRKAHAYRVENPLIGAPMMRPRRDRYLKPIADAIAPHWIARKENEDEAKWSARKELENESRAERAALQGES